MQIILSLCKPLANILMLASYRFDSNYHPAPSSGLSDHAFRLLEAGTFAPGQYCPVLTREFGQLRMHYCQWGNEGIHHIYHRRAVTPVASLVRDQDQATIFPSSRCLIPGNAYYFQTPDGRNWKVEAEEEDGFCFAGLRYRREGKDGEMTNHFSILATAAQGALSDYHLLMPVMIPKHLEMAWLNPATSQTRINAWLTEPCSASLSICEVQYLQEKDPSWSHLAA